MKFKLSALFFMVSLSSPSYADEAMFFSPLSYGDDTISFFPSIYNTQWGKPADLGDGTVRTFVSINEEKKPQLIGVYFTEKMFNNMPTEHSDGKWDILDEAGNVVEHINGHERVLDFPKAIKVAPHFKNFVLNYEPEGHIPPGIYDVPHFDFHFYTITNETRLSIRAPAAKDMCEISDGSGGTTYVPLDCAIYALATAPVPADQQPPDYINVGAAEPGMGNHLIDLNSPEFTGLPFTHTWIFGSFAGNLSFFEPMVTKAYFLSLSTDLPICTAIKLPAAAPEAGWYPKEYCIRHMAKQKAYAVYLNNFTWLKKSSGI